MKYLLKEDRENVDYGRVVSPNSKKTYLKGYNFNFFAKPADLGLSVKWADRCYYDKLADDAKIYFQWGDTQGYSAKEVGRGEGKKFFGWGDYKFGDGTTFTKYNRDDGKTILDLEDDAAYVSMKYKWRLPTQEEADALFKLPKKWVYQIRPTVNDEWGEFIEVDSIEEGNALEGEMVAKGDGCNKELSTKIFVGVKIIGTNGNSIIIPANGYVKEGIVRRDGIFCSFWCNCLDVKNNSIQDAIYCVLASSSGIIRADYDYRFMGFGIFPVCDY